MASVEDSRDFVARYVSELGDLTFNSKAIINTLTMLANENKQESASIAEAIQCRIQDSPSAHKLPALYLLDSIVKNVGLPYTALFARDLPAAYMSAWLAAPESRQSLQKLYQTWHKFFPADVLSSISELSSPEAQQARQQAQQTQVPNIQPVYLPQQYHQQAYELPAPSYPVNQQDQFPPPQQAQWQSQQVPAYGGFAAGPSPPAFYQQPLYEQQPQQMQMGLQQIPAAQEAFSYPQLYAQPPPSQVNYAAAYTPTYPQPHYISSQPLPGIPSFDPPAAASQEPVQPVVPEFLSQLITSGLIPAGDPTHPPKPVEIASSEPATFEAAKSQVLTEAAVRKLLGASEASRARFLDQRLHKQRRIAATSKVSRQWFVIEGDWLAGTSADAEAAPAFFDDLDQKEETAVGDEEASVPADPSQPTCSLSGEDFESVWDDATNGWRYRGAIALNAEQAERYGLQEGALVKVSCLGPSEEVELDGAAEALAASEGQETMDEMAAAAEEETQDPADQEDEKRISGEPSGGKRESSAEAEPKKRLKIS